MSFESIAGYEEEKKELLHLREMLRNANQYLEKGVRIPRGVVLYGEPGIGKTVLAKSIADNEITLVELRAGDCQDNQVDVAIRDAFERAKKNVPSVLLLDELDKIAGTSTSFFMEDNDNVNKILLQELDKLSNQDVLLVVATCNDIENLGEALLRPGRFDRLIKISVPDERTRYQILKKYFFDLKFRKQLDLKEVAKLTRGYTGAKLECLVNEAGILAMEIGKRTINENILRIVMNRMAFNGSERSLTDNIDELRRIAVHEAGHALVAEYLLPDSIIGASLIPQGDSEGHIHFLTTNENSPSISCLEKEIAVLLAGRAAERAEYGDVFLGSECDLNTATKKMYNLITKQAAYGYESLLNNVMQIHGNVAASDSNKEAVGKVFGKKMKEMDDLASQIISEHRSEMMNIVEELMTKRVLDKEDIKMIIKK